MYVDPTTPYLGRQSSLFGEKQWRLRRLAPAAPIPAWHGHLQRETRWINRWKQFPRQNKKCFVWWDTMGYKLTNTLLCKIATWWLRGSCQKYLNCLTLIQLCNSNSRFQGSRVPLAHKNGRREIQQSLLMGIWNSRCLKNALGLSEHSRSPNPLNYNNYPY